MSESKALKMVYQDNCDHFLLKDFEISERGYTADYACFSSGKLKLDFTGVKGIFPNEDIEWIRQPNKDELIILNEGVSNGNI